MISKEIFISMIVIMYLIQFITCPTVTETKPKSSAATNTGVKPRGLAKSKSATKATGTTEVGISPDDNTAKIPEKPTGLRHNLFKPIKSIFWPIKFLWGKFKNFNNKGQNKNKAEDIVQEDLNNVTTF